MMPSSELEVAIVHHDEDLLVLEKPSGLLTTGRSSREDCLVRRAEALDASAPNLHPLSRLDREVSGLVIFARTRAAAKAILDARRTGRYVRRYCALAEGTLASEEGVWNAKIGIDPQDPRRRLPDAGRAQKEAHTRYQVTAHVGSFVALDLFPKTGRTHQLRVHASAGGVPLLGDVHYRGSRRVAGKEGAMVTARRTMLHCAELRLELRTDHEFLFRCEPPPDFHAVGIALGLTTHA